MNKQIRTHGVRSKKSNHSSKEGGFNNRKHKGSNKNGRSYFSSSNKSSTNSFGRIANRNKIRSRRGPKKDFIDEKLFINKADKKEVENYIPKHNFSDFNFHPKLLENLVKKEFIHPSPIQDQSIPLGLSGRDVIGVANTGTGKTAAFLLPLINKIMADKRQKVLILAPTRELAQQIEQELRSFTFGMSIYSVACVGGAPINRQINELKRGVHFVIGTPGRVKDLILRKNLFLDSFSSIVLDEVDRMLDMGFINDIRHILGLIPKKGRQGLFFSATLSREIKQLCEDFLVNPEIVSVKIKDTSSSINQDVVRVKDMNDKISVLHDILIHPDSSKVLIFREMKRSVDELTKELKSRGFKAMGLHGDMRNRERTRAVKALTQGDAQIVIATDVAARGIDIPDITHVINYDIPNDYDTYVHRIGRTGRGNSMGTALTFIQSRR